MYPACVALELRGYYLLAVRKAKREAAREERFLPAKLASRGLQILERSWRW